MSTIDVDKEIQENLGMAGSGRTKKIIRWVIFLVILATVGVLGWRSWRAAQAPKPIRYITQDAKIGDLTVTVTATGTLKPTKEVTVGSEVSGILDTVEVDYNDHVKVGQVVARVNTDKLKAQVDQSKASLEVARATLAQAKVTQQETEAEVKRLEEVRRRTNGQLPSQHDMDTAKASYSRAVGAVQSAQATVSQSEATLAVDETNLSKAVIRSPVDGVVLTRSVDPGQTIQASFSAPTLFTLAQDLTRMELYVSVDEADVGTVKEGQSAAFTVDAYPGRTFPGKITQVRYNSTTTSGVVTYETILTVDNKELLLRPGMTATAEITVHSVKDALLVPNAALRFTPTQDAGAGQSRGFMSQLMPGPPRRDNTKTAQETFHAGQQSQVWRLISGKPEPVEVKIGLTDGKFTEVVSGDVAAGVPLVTEAEKEMR